MQHLGVAGAHEYVRDMLGVAGPPVEQLAPPVAHYWHLQLAEDGGQGAAWHDHRSPGIGHYREAHTWARETPASDPSPSPNCNIHNIYMGWGGKILVMTYVPSESSSVWRHTGMMFSWRATAELSSRSARSFSSDIGSNCSVKYKNKSK